MATTMHAVVVEAFGRPLALRERDIPVPGPGQILVKTEACGVCLTDFHAARGNRPSARLADGIALHFGCNLASITVVFLIGYGRDTLRLGARVAKWTKR